VQTQIICEPSPFSWCNQITVTRTDHCHDSALFRCAQFQTLSLGTCALRNRRFPGSLHVGRLLGWGFVAAENRLEP